MRVTLKIMLPAIAILVIASGVHAYGNKGPHQKVNELALRSWIRDVQKNPYGPPKGEEYLLRYDLNSVIKIPGESVVQDGQVYSSGVSALDMKVGDKELTFNEWIQEGGYTADEPELFSALRHFYDPTRSNGVTYLSDHVSKFVADVLTSRFDVTDPLMDAKEWALTGPARAGYERNFYSWDQGLTYMSLAFTNTTKDKDRMFAKAWRACGETMHLMADMTVPAHVRNDAHPSDAPAGAWRFDPYEKFMKAPQIEQCVGAGIDQSFLEQIKANTDPGAMFDQIAGFTNKSFFSADTIVGRTQDGHVLTNQNGLAELKAPRLENCKFDTEFLNYTSTVLGKEVIQTHGLWTENTWGNWIRNKIGGSMGKSYGMDTPLEAVLTQGKVLVPVAVASNQRLFDMFLPRVEVIIDNIEQIDIPNPEPDDVTCKIEGKVVHHPAGAYKTAMQFSAGPDSWIMLYVNGVPQAKDSKKYKLEIDEGKITGDLTKLELSNGDKVALEIGLGGLMIKSDDYVVEAETKGYWELVEVVQGAEGPKCLISGNGGSITHVLTNDQYPENDYSGKASWTFPQRVEIGTDGEASFDIVFDKYGASNPYTGLVLYSVASDGKTINSMYWQGGGSGTEPLHAKAKIGFYGGWEIADPTIVTGHKMSYMVSYQDIKSEWGQCFFLYRLTKKIEKPKTPTIKKAPAKTTPKKTTPKKK